jgi:arylsulfatase A-like enzyme
MSDNGYHLGEHGIPVGKQSPYDESLRVPLIVRGPGVPAGALVDAIALNIDLAPTFAELAGPRPRPSSTAARSCRSARRCSYYVAAWVPRRALRPHRSGRMGNASTGSRGGSGAR